MTFRSICVGVAFAIPLLGASAHGGGPADELFRAVPGDALMAVALEDLRGQAPAIVGGPLGRGLWDWAPLKLWRSSGGEDQIRAGLKSLETAWGTSVESLRDDLLGRAVVLSLHREAGTSEPRGLVFVKVGDRALLDRIVAWSNASEGWRVEEIKAPGVAPGSLFARTHPVAGNPVQAYAFLPNDIFAWGNSRSLVESAASGAAGLGSAPEFRALMAELPDRCLVRGFVHPGRLAPVLDPSGDVGADLARRWLGASEGLGFGVEWRDGPIVHAVQIVRPGAWDGHLRDAVSTAPDAALRERIPAAALVAVGLRADFAAIGAGVWSLIPPDERPRLETLRTAARGVLLGRDLIADVVPRLGPALVGYLDGPRVPGGDPSGVVLIALSDAQAIGPAIENGLRTALALAALNVPTGARVDQAQIRGVGVTSLSGAGLTVAFAVGSGVLALGTDRDAVADAARGERSGAIGADTRFERFRARHFADAETFAYLDLEALADLAASRRGDWPRWLRTKDPKDLDDFGHLVDLAKLFRGAFVSGRVSGDLRVVRITAGAVGR